MPIGYKEWSALYRGCRIRVVNTWIGGAKLYINDEIKDVTYNPIAIGQVILKSRIDGREENVEIICKSILSTKIKILVDGKQVGGDHF
jgi:hypothetical protein